jgi:hypothetical protein
MPISKLIMVWSYGDIIYSLKNNEEELCVLLWENAQNILLAKNLTLYLPWPHCKKEKFVV